MRQQSTIGVRCGLANAGQGLEVKGNADLKQPDVQNNGDTVDVEMWMRGM